MRAQITSADVADSLGLTVGKYEYTERRQEISVSSNMDAASPDASTAADSSRFVPSEVATTDTLLPDSGHKNTGRTDTVLDASNALCQTPADKATVDECKNLHPAIEMGDHRLDSNVVSDCGGCASTVRWRDAVTIDENKSSTSSGNIDHPVTTAVSDNDCCEGSNVNGSARRCDLDPGDGCPTKTTDASAADDTNRLPLTSEMPKQSTSVSDGTFCEPPVDSEYMCQLADASFNSDTSASSGKQSDNITDWQQSSSSETVTLLPTPEDLEGLLKVIARAQ